MKDSKRPLRVFLCHASSDKPAVKKLYERLVKDGIDAWLDKEKLIPGQNWQLEIPKAVINSDVVIVCLSPQSITKEGFVQKEIKFALDSADEKPDGTIFIIPARLENCDVPERINKFQWVDLFSDDGYDWLLKAMQIRADGVGAVIAPEKNKNIAEEASAQINSPLKSFNEKKETKPISNLPQTPQASPENKLLEKSIERKNVQLKSFLPIESMCIYFTNEYKMSFKGKYIWKYEKKGTLRLTEEAFTFRSGDFLLDIDFENVKSIDTKLFARIPKVVYIAINYIENRKDILIGLLPFGTTRDKKWASMWSANKVVESWFGIFNRIPKLSAKIRTPLEIL
jgi:hypothetical protein